MGKIVESRDVIYQPPFAYPKTTLSYVRTNEFPSVVMSHVWLVDEGVLRHEIHFVYDYSCPREE